MEIEITLEDIVAVKNYLNGNDIISSMAKAGLTFVQIDMIIPTVLRELYEYEKQFNNSLAPSVEKIYEEEVK